MRIRVLVLVASSLFALVVADSGRAAVFDFEGSISLIVGNLPPVVVTGAGTATVNGSGAAGHLNQLTLDGGITGSAVVPVTDPIVTAGGIVSVIASGALGQGVLAPVSGVASGVATQLTQATLPVPGQARICLFFTGCNSGSIDLDLTANGTRGWGIGGLITAGSSGAQRVSMLAAPWTLNLRTLSNRTDNQGISFRTAQGFAHGPASLTSSTGITSGVVQFITPLQIKTSGIPGANDTIAQFGELRVHFAPEPGWTLLLGAGIAALGALGTRRRR